MCADCGYYVHYAYSLNANTRRRGEEGSMTVTTTDALDLLPLTPVAFEILLSLSGEDRHGYAIMRAVDLRTEGRRTLHAGSLYRALARLVDSGLIEEVIAPPDDGADERRRYYRLTGLGRQAGVAEAQRLESQVGAARDFGLLGQT
jgi:DNA-binding PadR family transcriptional regulator